MFTGIIEEIGEVVSMEKVADLLLWDGSKGEGYVLIVACKLCLEGCYQGASICVNGACLTATEFDDKSVTFGVAPETLRRTNLGLLKKGSKVNLERAAASGSRNSGHYVQGHVDGTGEIIDKSREGESLWIKVKVPAELMTGLVPKGYVAIDGTSLTVCEVNVAECWFNFMLVQYTQTKIIVPQKQVSDLVNVEIDVLGKYVQKSFQSVTERVDAMENRIQTQLDTIVARLDAIERTRSNGT